MRTLHSLPFIMAGSLLLAISVPLRASELSNTAESRTTTAATSTFTYSTALKNTGVLAGAAGKATCKFMRVGTVNTQQLTISLVNLHPSTSYQLAAFLGSDTFTTGVTTFMSDAKGKFKVAYSKKDGSASMSGTPLPDALNPLNNVRELDIVSAGQTLLSTDVTHADKLAYQFKGPMGNTGTVPAAAGALQLRATEKITQFGLKVSGLPPNTDFLLSINMTVTQKVTSDSKGKLNLKTLPGGSPNALGIHTVALANNTSGIVALVVKGLGIPSADTLAPFVLSTNPASAATGVPINRPITATFNKTMDATTINPTTFTLTQGLVPVAVSGILTYAGTTATFTPASNLAVNATFTGTITTSVTDLAGNDLASTFTWSFTTGATASAGPAPIALGSANSFAILAGSTVTSVGPTQINGDLGVSPGSAVVGFPPGNVTGATHAADGAAGQAKNDLLSAYNDAAGRLGSAVLPGNLGGLTFTPGLYNNQSSTMISGTGTSAIFTLDAQGDANAVFIFQMASTLTTDPGTSIVLSGGAKAANVYWQVGSSATLGTTCIFKGNILADQSITLTTGATLEGRALTRVGAVTLDSNTITVPAP